MVPGLRGLAVCCLAAAALLVLPMLLAPAAAQTVHCNSIDDCTTVIRSGKYDGKDLAGLFSDRCSEYIYVDYGRAIADCNEAIRLDSHSSAIDDRGLAYLEKGDYDHAIADFSAAIKLADEGYRGDAGYRILYFIGRARAYRAKGDYDHATADLDGAILLASSEQLSSGLLSLRGEVYSMKGDNNRAIADYNASLKAKPNVASALYGRGLAKLKTGDGTGGNADIAAAKAIRPDIADEAARSKRNFWKEVK
jgi:tetratricopeptide (TPR) repeat protein